MMISDVPPRSIATEEGKAKNFCTSVGIRAMKARNIDPWKHDTVENFREVFLESLGTYTGNGSAVLSDLTCHLDGVE